MESIYPLKLYLKYRASLTLIILGGILNIITWLIVALQIHPQEEPLFLHYTIIFGVDYLGPWQKVFFLPAFGLIIWLINALVGWLIFHKEKFASLALNSVSVICQIFLLIGAELLVFLNG